MSGSEEELSKRLHRNIRRQVRRAEENGLRVQTDRNGELVGDFYRVLSRFTHQAGTPVFSQDFLNNVVRYLAGNFNVVMVYMDDTAIGGYFQLELGDTVYGVWGATLHEYLEFTSGLLGLLDDSGRCLWPWIFVCRYGTQPCGLECVQFQETVGRRAGLHLSAVAGTRMDGRTPA